MVGTLSRYETHPVVDYSSRKGKAFTIFKLNIIKKFNIICIIYTHLYTELSSCQDDKINTPT